MADQRSLTGYILDSNAPGEYYGEADMLRRRAAEAFTAQNYQNPNVRRGPMSSSAYGGGLPYDYEGLLSNVALKYGLEAAKELVRKLPTMSKEQIRAISYMVSQASREADSMYQRERQAYERAGMENVGGAYRPKHNGQIP